MATILLFIAPQKKSGCLTQLDLKLSVERTSCKGKTMYCPVCFNETLILAPRGVVQVVINKKQLDNGRFIYNQTPDSEDEIFRQFVEKVEEFYKWYSRFQNIETIEEIELSSSSFVCSNGCKIDSKHKLSVIDILIPKEKVIETLIRLAQKYRLKIDLEIDEN